MRSLVLFFVFFINTTAVFSQITINLPLSRSVFQRDNNNSSTIHISGNFSGILDRLEARLVPVNEGQGTATEWTVIVNKPEYGSFVGNIKGFGGWYQLQVRGFINDDVVAQQIVDKVGIGEVFLIAGQSNSEGKRNYGEKSSTDDRVNCFNYERIDYLDEIPPYQAFSHIEASSSIAPRGQGSWCWGELGDLLAKRLNVPIMFFNAAYQGTSIENWYSSSIGVPTKHPFFGFTFPKDTPYSNLRISLQYYISQLGLRSVLWQQGEAELDLKTTQDYYAMALKNVIDKSRLDSGKKISWMVASSSLTYFTQTYQPIINAQNSLINPENYIFEGPNTDLIQVPRTEGVHFQNSGISDLAKAWDDKMTNSFFSQSFPYSPAPIVALNAKCAAFDKVTLSLSASYTSQKWSNNTTASTLTVSDGEFSSLVRDQIGNYFFTSKIDVKKVFPTKIPFVYAKNSPSFCDGLSTDLLTDSPDYVSFLWNTGETKKQITVSKTGSFSVRGINAIGCISPESNIINTNSITPPGKPVIYQSDNAVCEGNTITLASTAVFDNVWSTNATTPVITFSTVGDYSITVKDKDRNGCISESSDPAIFSIKARPETPEISQIGVFTLQAVQKSVLSNLIYQWKQDDIVPASNTAFLKVNTASFLTVRSLKKYVIDSKKTITCQSNLSGAFSFIPDVSLKDIIIYPNPTLDGMVMLEAKDNVKDFTMTVYSLIGQHIYSTPIPNLTERRLVDLSFLQNGKYIIKLSNAEIVETKQIIIDKK